MSDNYANFHEQWPVICKKYEIEMSKPIISESQVFRTAIVDNRFVTIDLLSNKLEFDDHNKIAYSTEIDRVYLSRSACIIMRFLKFNELPKKY